MALPGEPKAVSSDQSETLHLERLPRLRDDRRLVTEVLQRSCLSFRTIALTVNYEGLADV